MVSAQAQTSKLRGRIGRGDGFVALRLDGIIDEHNGLSQWVTSVGSGDSLLVDLGGVKRLNSVGVRDWVLFLRALRPNWRAIVLFDCPPPVMNEVNFVKNFAEGAVITTFHAPLFCTRCNKEDQRLLDALDLKRGGGTLPSFRCERTDCQNALDDDEETYLAFLAELPSLPEPERLARLTAIARDALKLDGDKAVALDATGNASAARANVLAQLGHGAQPNKVVNAATADASSPATKPQSADAPLVEPKHGPDWLFVSAIAAMVAVLGVLIYLLMTLE